MSWDLPAGVDRLPGEEVLTCADCDETTDPLAMFSNADNWEQVERTGANGQRETVDLCPDCYEEWKENQVEELEDEE